MWTGTAYIQYVFLFDHSTQKDVKYESFSGGVNPDSPSIILYHFLKVWSFLGFDQQAKAPDCDSIRPSDAFPSRFVDEDLWKDARMPEVIRYLYGGLGTQLPQEWHDIIPPKIWAW